jgi:hypothetical protein
MNVTARVIHIVAGDSAAVGGVDVVAQDPTVMDLVGALVAEVSENL